MTRLRESSRRGSAANPQGGSFGERPIRAGEALTEARRREIRGIQAQLICTVMPSAMKHT